MKTGRRGLWQQNQRSLQGGRRGGTHSQTHQRSALLTRREALAARRQQCPAATTRRALPRPPRLPDTSSPAPQKKGPHRPAPGSSWAPLLQRHARPRPASALPLPAPACTCSPDAQLRPPRYPTRSVSAARHPWHGLDPCSHANTLRTGALHERAARLSPTPAACPRPGLRPHPPHCRLAPCQAPLPLSR